MLYGYYTNYAYVVIIKEDEDGNKETMEFASEDEAYEYFNKNEED